MSFLPLKFATKIMFVVHRGYLTCSRCRFATCCSKAMVEHIVIFHESGKSTPEFTLGRMVQLPADLFCVCGFKTCSGNRLGKFYVSRISNKQVWCSWFMAGRFTFFMQMVGVENLSVTGKLNDHERVCVWPLGG
jgi:hypothetical protein